MEVDLIFNTLAYFFVQVVAVLTALKIHRELERKERMDRLMELRDYAEETLQEIEDKRIRIKAEIDGDMIFVYNGDTGDYMANAKSYEELEDELRKKFPGKLFDIPRDQLLKMQKMKKTIRSQEAE